MYTLFQSYGMNTNAGLSCRSLMFQLFLLYVMLCLSACAERSVLRDKERAHYENLESELLSKQKAEDQRLRDEYRIEHDIRPPDSKILSATEQNTKNKVFFANDKTSKTIEPASANSNHDITAPVVTQVVVGQPSKDIKARNWSRQNYPSPVNGSTLCVIASNTVLVKNGGIDTQVRIIVSNDTVFFRSDATFNTTALDTGFQIDAGFPIPFDRYLNELTAVIDKNYYQVLNSMKSGLTLSVSFAYSPQLSTSDIHVVELDLDSFNQVWSENTECTAN